MKAPKLPPRQTSNTKHVRRKLTLLQYVDRYLSARDTSPDYQVLMRSRIGTFVQWLGKDPPIADLNCELVNEWLEAVLLTDLSPVTVDNYRRSLRCVWFYAYEERDNDCPPLRLKKIRIPEQRIEAFTHAEINKLVEAARDLKGFFAVNGVRRSDFWAAAIHAAYSTGLRRGDLLRLKRAEVRDDGVAVVVQNKTGHRVCVRFSPESLEAIAKIRCDDDQRILPWPCDIGHFAPAFKQIVVSSGVKRGTFRWLRRSAGSYAEAVLPGSGSRALGHRTLAVFNGHYNDESISVAQPVSPPPVSAPRKLGAV